MDIRDSPRDLLQEALDARFNGEAQPRPAPDSPVKPASRTRRAKQLYLPHMPEGLVRRLAQLPGRALLVYWVLLLRSKLDRCRTVVLTGEFLVRFGGGRNDKLRGLAALERAGLVRVARQDRHNPTVTLLPVPAEPEGDNGETN